MKHLLLKTVVLSMVLGVVAPPLAYSDVFMKQHHYSPGGSATPGAEDRVDEVWMTPEGVRTDGPKMSTIIRLNENKMYMLNHENKTYVEMPLDIGQKMNQAMGEVGEEDKAAFQGFMKNMFKMEATVTPLGETKKIRDWNCQKYQITLTTMMGPITQEVWASQDIKVDPALYERFRSAENLMMPGMKEGMSQMAEEMKKVKGVQVLNTSTQNIMNRTMTSVTELLEYRQARAPAGLFEIPNGYQKVNRPTPGTKRRTMPEGGKGRTQSEGQGRIPGGIPSDFNLDKLSVVSQHN